MSENNYERHKRDNYSDPSPYPKIKVVEQNPHYARLIMDDYAGVVSEFTAISQYLYHYFVSKKVNEDLGELFENVSINEMLHMEILANLILALGGNPQIRGSFSTGNRFWNGKFIYYGNELCEQLKEDIEAEYAAIDAYRKHIQLINDSYVQAILKRIILDEKVHIKLFNQALFKFCGCKYREFESNPICH